MKKTIVLFVIQLLIVLPAFSEDVLVPSGDGRQDVIENELQKAAEWAERAAAEQTQESFLEIDRQTAAELDQLKGKHVKDETMGQMSDNHLQDRAPVIHAGTVSQDIHKKFEQNNMAVMEKDTGRSIGYSLHEEEKKVAEKTELENRLGNNRGGPHQFELGPEIYYYKYTERIGVKVDGVKGGLVGAYQYRFEGNEPIRSWNDFLHATNKINFLRLEGRFSYGRVDYEGSGTWGGIPDLNFETRGLAGFEVPISERVMVTPYAGLGYRYLYNDFSKYPAGLVDGQQYYSGYDRESSYVYLPLGVEAKTEFSKKWSLSLKGEFDFFIWGKQISHLEDMVDGADVNAGYDKLENTQEKGIGWRTSARLTRQGSRFDFFVEPFLRYWHIEDSEFSFVTTSGSLICSGNLCSGGIEPDNKTWEYGVNFGTKF